MIRDSTVRPILPGCFEKGLIFPQPWSGRPYPNKQHFFKPQRAKLFQVLEQNLHLTVWGSFSFTVCKCLGNQPSNPPALGFPLTCITKNEPNENKEQQKKRMDVCGGAQSYHPRGADHELPKGDFTNR